MHAQDRARTVWLFGKPYWWTREEQRLTLRPADSLLTVPLELPSAPVLADLVQWLAARPR
ncbi:hypothetical protein YUYDRAFT_02105 [Streptomyces sp. ScaeMP-e48]|uniref:hypothetical protein n=1 Tax=Streptomyces sp. ScaeMP-e48 TaxID=1100823 RepID=UPI0008239A62|nr:hypothetical protein [Streptomyces sp. ScaeMP-e48]SCK20237.1 hypothetical protein YUYDRAFT_02105 [Streptomyces sp. ScaeMP-e48]